MFFTALVISVLQAASSQIIGAGVVPDPCVSCGVQFGEWSQWSEWSTCAVVIGVMSQTRSRTCSLSSCPGESYSESRPCTIYVPPPVPPPPVAVPQWSEWGPWGTCSASCGGGIAQRTRMCVDPCSNCCVGIATETQPCNTHPCCEWSSWGPWSQCSVTCGAGGQTYRTRQCSCPGGCSGISNEQMPCETDIPCPTPSPTLPPAPIVPIPHPPLCITCYIIPPPCVVCSVYMSGWSLHPRYKRNLLKLE